MQINRPSPIRRKKKKKNDRQRGGGVTQMHFVDVLGGPAWALLMNHRLLSRTTQPGAWVGGRAARFGPLNTKRVPEEMRRLSIAFGRDSSHFWSVSSLGREEREADENSAGRLVRFSTSPESAASFALVPPPTVAAAPSIAAEFAIINNNSDSNNRRLCSFVCGAVRLRMPRVSR